MLRNTFIFFKDITLLKRLGISLLMLTLTRLVFFISNLNAFPGVLFSDFLSGIWMDCITIGIYFIPFYFFSVFPIKQYHTSGYQRFLKVIFHVTNGIMIALNLIDVEYYKYTGKRSTSDLYSMVTEENDMGQLFGAFILDFWWLILIFILLVIFSNWLYNKTKSTKELKFNITFELTNFVLVVAALFIMGRGGFSLRPADMLTAARLTKPQKVNLVANTPLSIIKTIGKAALLEKEYFPKGSPKIYNPIYTPNASDHPHDNPNIMVVILESFGDEWLGKKNGKDFTPFLDSLLNHSVYFENGFSNGKKSIEAMPSIFAGIPSLLDNPYISSNYGMNSIEALPEILQNLGYATGFYHGATNGSMKFDVFSAKLGFQKYFGRTEFNNEDQCDAAWGALDEYFLPWTAKSITSELKEPFLAGLFTLSSHHPYFVPEEYRDVLPADPNVPLAQSIAYADMSLKLFFEEAKKQPWYENTVFVLMADHTPAGSTPAFQSYTGMYRIPIAIFDPQNNQGVVEEKIFNQVDVMPTVLDLIGYKQKAYSFGNSYYDKTKVPFSINYISESYLYFQGDYMLNFIDDHVAGLYNYQLDSLNLLDSAAYYPKLTKDMEVKVKGFIQRYNNDLIHNNMMIKK